MGARMMALLATVESRSDATATRGHSWARVGGRNTCPLEHRGCCSDTPCRSMGARMMALFATRGIAKRCHRHARALMGPRWRAQHVPPGTPKVFQRQALSLHGRANDGALCDPWNREAMPPPREGTHGPALEGATRAPWNTEGVPATSPVAPWA